MMLARLFYPDKGLPQVYDLTYLDEHGSTIGKTGYVYRLLSPDTEREVQFRKRAEEMGAASYMVHLMTPQEVRARIMEEEGTLFDQYLDSVSRLLGLDRALQLLPLIHQENRSSIQ